MYVIRARVTTRVDAEAPNQVGMFELDDLHRQTYHTAVDSGDFAIAVGVDRDIGRVAVLVLAVTRRALDAAVVLGCAKSGMHIDVDVGHRFVAVPARDLLDHQFQLVQQLWIDCRVTRPLSLLIVVQEIADL